MYIMALLRRVTTNTINLQKILELKRYIKEKQIVISSHCLWGGGSEFTTIVVLIKQKLHHI